MVNPSSEECSFHFFTRKLHFWFQDNLHDLHWWTNMVDTDLRLILFRRWYKICHTYVHQAAIGGGTTCPYEQLTPTSPTIVSAWQLFLNFHWHGASYTRTPRGTHSYRIPFTLKLCSTAVTLVDCHFRCFASLEEQTGSLPLSHPVTQLSGSCDL